MKLWAIISLVILTSCSSTKVKMQNKTLPQGKVKFCFIGDMGLGNGIQEKVARALRDEKCHSIHMVGDLVYPSGISSLDDPGLQEKFLKYYLPLTQENHRPNLNLIMGNHDYRGSVDAWKALAKKYPSVVFPNPYYLQNWNGLCLYHVDTNYYKLLKDYLKGVSQSNWLQNQRLEMQDKCSTSILLSHHPYKSRGPHHGNAKGLVKNFMEDYVIGKFEYLISGHEHVLADEGEEKGTRLLITGAGGNYTKGEEAGFLILEVEASQEKMTSLTHRWKRVSTKP